MTADINIYFGRPGSLQSIPHPRGGVQTTRDRPTAVFRTGGGGARVGRITGGKRQFTLSWSTLDYETFAILLRFDQGHEGPGPFAFIDPGQRNQLTVNQSAATSETNDTDNFTVSGSGSSLSSDPTTYYRGPRALKWTFAYASQAGTLSLDAPAADWPGIPVVDRDMCFSLRVKGGGPDPIITLTPKLTWYSAAGATLSTDSGNATPTTSASWTQMYVTANAPAGAAYVGCSVAASASTVGAGSILYLDELQLEEGATPGEWRPGTGVPPVQVLSLVDQWPWQGSDFRTGPVLTLQETGP